MKMTTAKNKKISGLLTMLFILCAFSYTSYAQSEENAVDNLVLKLRQKVLLSQQQSDEIKSILINYFKESSETNLNSAKERIENLLDNKQRAKYNIVKNDWWKSVINEAAAINDSK
jgi:hypothetical protein